VAALLAGEELQGKLGAGDAVAKLVGQAAGNLAEQPQPFGGF